MPFGIAAAGIGAAGALGSAALQSSAVSGASKAAQQDQRIAFLMANADLAPYRKAGEDALHQVEGIVGGGWGGYQNQLLSGFRTDPGYQWALDQGLRAVNAQEGASGLYDAGARDKARIAYAEGLANQQYGAYANRFDSYVNRLYSLAGAGQNSATQTATSALNTGTNMSNIAASQGAADASIYGNAAKGLGTIANDLFKSPGFQDSLRGLFSGSGSIYGDLGSNVNYASQVAGPTVSNMFGLPNMSSFGY